MVSVCLAAFNGEKYIEEQVESILMQLGSDDELIISDDGKPFDVYNIQGRKVKANTTTLKGLPSGIYIVNGRKLMVK